MQNQQKEFANVPAPILFTTNCIMPVKESYADRVFTAGVVQYPGMNDLQLTRELMTYGIAVYPLDTMGSTQQGVRICTSFFRREQEQLFTQRIIQFHKDHDGC